MLSQAEAEIVDSLGGRLTFQQHANAFLIRQCLHNYNDADCIKIMRAVVPALEKCEAGTPLLINEVILPASGSTTRNVEHHLRQIDLCMMVTLGAKQRSEREFESLLKQADSRFEVSDISFQLVDLLCSKVLQRLTLINLDNCS